MAGGGFQENQSPEEIHRLLWSAIAKRVPISAMYKDHPRLLCPHRMGWNRNNERQLFSYQYGGESEHGLGPPGGEENWRCMEFDKLVAVRVLEGPWHTAKNYSRPPTCIVRLVDDQP